MKAFANGHLEVVAALVGEYGADVNIKNVVSCVHQPELTFLFGWCMSGMSANLYIATEIMVDC